MSAPPDPPTCPHCGTALPVIGGLCPRCLARAALDRDTGWLSAAVSASAPAATAASQEELTQIGQWRLIGTLGAGGMGRVYHGESVREPRAAALKVLDAHWGQDPAMVARFEKEAATLRQLDHPNIVRLIECAETDDGRLCLVTELVQGCDLGRLLRAERLPAARCFDIFDKVGAAVEHAHQHGLVHRDIKPSNILVGLRDEVKLADFGLAGELHPEGSRPSTIGGLTATNDQFGTAYYLAPERMLGTAPSGPQADVYALGVLLYHLLTGQMPLGHYTPASVLSGLPRELDAILAQALEADPAKRTPDVTTLRHSAQRLWREHSAGTLRARRLRRLLGMAAGVVLLATGAGAGAWWQQERMKPPVVVYPDPQAATATRPWENSLGMTFVPLPGSRVLLAVHETRRRDATAYLTATNQALDLPWLHGEAARRLQAYNNSLWNDRNEDGTWTNFTFDDPGWPVTPDHPVIFVSAYNALRMCAWLTWKEQREGRLQPHQHYRLPTTQEWLRACGGPEASRRPGNVAGSEFTELPWPEAGPTFASRDPFPRTAPVGSFPAELHGLHDISGNVSEWVNDYRDDPTELTPVRARLYIHLHGPAFLDGSESSADLNRVRLARPNNRLPHAGFRMVLEVEAPAQEQKPADAP